MCSQCRYCSFKRKKRVIFSFCRVASTLTKIYLACKLFRNITMFLTFCIGTFLITGEFFDDFSGNTDQKGICYSCPTRRLEHVD